MPVIINRLDFCKSTSRTNSVRSILIVFSTHPIPSFLLSGRHTRYTVRPGSGSAFARCYMQVNASDKVNVTDKPLLLPSLRQRRTYFSGRKSLGLK